MRGQKSHHDPRARHAWGRRRRAALAAAGAAALLATPVSGADVDPRDLTSLSLEDLLDVTIVTASRREQRAADAPASVTVLTSDDIAAFGWRSLAEALRTVPGLQATDDRNYLAVGARGFAVPGDYSNRVLVLVDGHRVNDPIYHSSDLQEYFPVPVGMIDRIEVVRGPGSTLYGSDALFAVINVITRDGSGAPESAVRGAVGTQSTADVEGRHVGTHGAWKVAAGARRIESAGDSVVRSPGLPGIEDADDLSAWQAFARATRGSFTLTATACSRRKEIPTASYGTWPTEGSSTVDERAWIEAAWERDLRKGTLTARASLDTYDYRGSYLFDYSDAGDGSKLQAWKDSSHAAWLRAETHYNAELGSRVRLAVGADYENALEVNQRGWLGDTTDFDVDSPLASWGMYAQADVKIAARVDAVVGMKWADLGPGGNSLSHRTGIIVRPARRTTLKLLHGTAFRAPTPFEMDYGAVNREGLVPALEGEHVTTSEVAIVQQLPRGLELGVALFSNRLENLLRSDIDENNRVYFVNDGEVSARGLEWSLDGRWRSGWVMKLSGSFQRAEDETGRRLVNSPATIVNAAVVAPLTQSKRSTLALESQWLGSRRTVAGKQTGASFLTSLAWKLNDVGGVKGLALDARVTNLFDEGAPVTGGAEHAQDAIPSPERRVMFGVTWTF